MIDREKVINDLQDAVNDDWMWRHADYYALTMERAIALLKEQPEIIRCKDCIWFHKPDTEKKLCKCNYHGFVTDGDKYCWWGEKNA